MKNQKNLVFFEVQPIFDRRSKIRISENKNERKDNFLSFNVEANAQLEAPVGGLVLEEVLHLAAVIEIVA